MPLEAQVKSVEEYVSWVERAAITVSWLRRVPTTTAASGDGLSHTQSVLENQINMKVSNNSTSNIFSLSGLSCPLFMSSLIIDSKIVSFSQLLLILLPLATAVPIKIISYSATEEKHNHEMQGVPGEAVLGEFSFKVQLNLPPS